MAEAAGLVLGGVALVGLISTCVEISDYLESAKNRAGEVKMALTKVNLIKQRLDDWGAARAVRPADMPPDSLSNHTIDPSTGGALPLMEETLDRKRFDIIIQQLDFLLSNLEKINETLQRRSEMAQERNYQNLYPRDMEVDSPEHDSAVDVQSNAEQQECDTPEAGAAVEREASNIAPQILDPNTQGGASHHHPDQLDAHTTSHPTQIMPESLVPVRGDGQRGAQGVPNRIANNTAYNDSTTVAGYVGVQTSIERPLGDVNDNRSRDKSHVFAGAISEGALAQIGKIKEAGARNVREENN